MGFRIVVIRPSKPIVDMPLLHKQLVECVEQAAVDGKTFMKEYPPRRHITRASVYGQAFVSDKQRRWFFAALRDGRLQGHRNKNLAKAWNSEVVLTTDKITGTVYCSPIAPYVKWVQVQETQSRFMEALGWKTEVFMLRALEPDFRARIAAIFGELA